MNNIKYSILLIFLFSCNVNITPVPEFTSYSGATFPKKDHCDAKFVIKLEKEPSEYILIGTCRSKAEVAKGITKENDNKALENVWNCACSNGADYVVIQTSEVGETLISSNGISSTDAYLDHIIADIYKEKR